MEFILHFTLDTVYVCLMLLFVGFTVKKILIWVADVKGAHLQSETIQHEGVVAHKNRDWYHISEVHNRALLPAQLPADPVTNADIPRNHRAILTLFDSGSSVRHISDQMADLGITRPKVTEILKMYGRDTSRGRNE